MKVAWLSMSGPKSNMKKIKHHSGLRLLPCPFADLDSDFLIPHFHIPCVRFLMNCNKVQKSKRKLNTETDKPVQCHVC